MWSDNGQWANGGPPAEPTDFTPPLVRAVRFGNAGLVRVLLAHGADPNVGYHGPYITIPNGWYDTGEKPEGHPPYPKIVCGRPVQLAMELYGDGEVLRLLLDAGADIALPQPVWPCPTHLDRAVPVHTCKLAPRSVYLKVTAALEAAVARR
ncbi:kinase-like protein [Apiospora kogelbergensis]|uniref:kinase-like protein n=1 Tax=Apiospora kogelbergensis TaxID=1337665 RepID=UPI003130D684